MFVVAVYLIGAIVAKRNSDVPYLEPLLEHLKKDVSLEKYFSKKDFFAMPKADLADLEEAIKKDCPSPRSLWIFPGNNAAFNQAQTRNPNCLPKILHSFNILLTFQCIRNPFELKFNGTEVYLDGSFMELSEARKAVKKSINNFNKTLNSVSLNNGFDFISWLSDEMLYPDEDAFLISNSVYQTLIL